MVNIKKLLAARIFLYLLLIESLFAFIFLFNTDADVKNAVMFGFSSTRLLLLSILGGVFFLAFFMLFRLGFLVGFISKILENKKVNIFINIVCFTVIGMGMLFFFIPAQRMGEAVYYRLIPLVSLVFFIALEIIVGVFIWMNRKVSLNQFSLWIQPLRLAVGIILIFILLWFFVWQSRVGIQPESSGWFAPGTPLLGQQVIFSWIIGSSLIFLGRRYSQDAKFDLLIGFILWLSAVLVWWLQPMHDWGYFTPKPTPPNFEYYPYSDAAIYDGFAQNLLIGSSRTLGVTNRPLYSFFIAFLHLIGGQKFEDIIFLQIMACSIFPVFVYLLASHLGWRSAGVIAGLLVLLRERNSIALTNVIEVSHVKLLMSDVPTMTLMAVFIYFFMKWLHGAGNRTSLGIVAGGFFGLTVLIRSQSQLLIPIALLGLILAWKFNWKTFIWNSSIFILGLLVVVFPWIIRNYQVSGHAVIEYQSFYTKIIASGYTSSPDEIKTLPDETQGEYDDRMKALIFKFILDNPIEVMRFYSSYFIHNEISSVAIFPMTFRFFELKEYVSKVGYWSSPMDGLLTSTLFAFFLTLSVIAVGIGSAFHRHQWVGLIPLLFHLGYSFSVVPVRMSGWRYILPVDWVAILYFSLGLAQISMIILGLFFRDINNIFLAKEKQLRHFSWRRIVTTFLPFMLIGFLFPLVEWLIPARYPPLPVNKIIDIYIPNGVLLDNSEIISVSTVESFLKTEAGATILYGRALYPAFYRQGEFWGESSPNLIEASKFSRLQLNLIGYSRTFVFLPMQDAPAYFPHASDVFIIGCKLKNSVMALIVEVDGRILSSSPWTGLKCLMLE